MDLKKYIQEIGDINQEASEKALNHWDSLTHPIGSLGMLEKLTIQLAGIQGKTIPEIKKKSVIVMCADNGIFDEDISSSPQEFTQMLANAMVNGSTGVCSIAGYAKSDVTVVDIGMLHTMDLDNRILSYNIRQSTNNFYKEDAMTREEAIKAIQVGIQVAEDKIKEGVNIFGTGELGIANTTTSSAVLHALTKIPAEDCVGLGAGITDSQLEKKTRVVFEGVRERIKEDDDVIDILAKVGGLDIAGLVGVYLAGAKNHVPIVMDGIISSVAALAAVKLNDKVRNYIFPSHLSRESAAPKLFEYLELKPLVSLGMRLGEGSGCPFTFLILETGIHCMNNMGSLDKTEIDPNVQVNIRSKDE